jgi:hypothetical protein
MARSLSVALRTSDVDSTHAGARSGSKNSRGGQGATIHGFRLLSALPLGGRRCEARPGQSGILPTLRSQTFGCLVIAIAPSALHSERLTGFRARLIMRPRPPASTARIAPSERPLEACLEVHGNGERRSARGSRRARCERPALHGAVEDERLQLRGARAPRYLMNGLQPLFE